MRVLALMKYGPLAAGTRQRLLIYEPFLRAHGIEIDKQFLLGDAHVAGLANGRRPDPVAIGAAYVQRLWQLLNVGRYDLIWVYYEAFPWLPGLFEGLVTLTGKPFVFDFDDAVFHRYDANPSAVVRAALGHKFAPLLSRASACSCGNAYLQAYAARYCAHSVVIPTIVDTARYTPPNRTRRAGESVVVGWIGSASTWPYLARLLPNLLRVLARHGARLRVVGAGRGAEGIDGIEAIEWTQAGETAELQAMDIGIMPVPDEPFARGKCGFKLIQYMACGLPVVASPVGVNCEIVEDGRNGFLAHCEADWADRLECLINDPALRRQMGDKGRGRVVQRYSLDSQAPRLLALIRSAAAQGATIRAQPAGLQADG